MVGRCPDGFNFNPETTMCVVSNDFPCSDEPTETTSDAPTTTTPTTTAPTPTSTETTISYIDTESTTQTTPETSLTPGLRNDVCRNHPNGYFVNNPANCQAFWTCHDGEAYDAVCRPELNFNEADQVCDNPLNYPCDNEPSATTANPESTTTPMPPSITTTPIPPLPPSFSCPPTGISFSAIPDSCTRFRFCFAGTLIVRECAVGLHFDEHLQRCNFEEQTDCTRGMCPLVNDPENVVTHPSKKTCDG